MARYRRPAVFVVVSLAIVRIATLVRLARQITSASITRRSLLRNVVLGSVGVVVAELVGGFVYYFWPNKTGAFGKEVRVHPADLPAVGAPPYVSRPGKFYIINNDDGALALYWRCTHLGCTVPWSADEDRWHCPCHGSVFDRHGVRIAGPAPRPLDMMPMRRDPDGSVIVDTNPERLIVRSGYSPDQAMPLGL